MVSAEVSNALDDSCCLVLLPRKAAQSAASYPRQLTFSLYEIFMLTRDESYRTLSTSVRYFIRTWQKILEEEACDADHKYD